MRTKYPTWWNNCLIRSGDEQLSASTLNVDRAHKFMTRTPLSSFLAFSSLSYLSEKTRGANVDEKYLKVRANIKFRKNTKIIEIQTNMMIFHLFTTLKSNTTSPKDFVKVLHESQKLQSSKFRCSKDRGKASSSTFLSVIARISAKDG